MEYGLSGKCQTLLPEDKRVGEKKKKKVDMENSDCLVEYDQAGGRWRGAPIRGRRTGKGGGQRDNVMKS